MIDSAVAAFISEKTRTNKSPNKRVLLSVAYFFAVGALQATKIFVHQDIRFIWLFLLCLEGGNADPENATYPESVKYVTLSWASILFVKIFPTCLSR